MTKTIATLFAAIVGLGLFAFPVRDSLSARMNADDEESGPQNLWVWPTEAIPPKGQGNINPNYVWTPRIGVWYYRIAANGYLLKDNNNLIDWWESGVTTSFGSGYSAGAFLPLEAGVYSISATVDGRAQFRVGFYREVENGFLWNSWKELSAQTAAGSYERTFTVPQGCSLVLISPTSSSSTVLTTTNIEIYRLD